MLYLILSVFCSVFVGVVIKISKKYNADIFQMITINYLISTILSVLLFDINFVIIPNDIPFVNISVLIILLPTIFGVLFKSVQQVGIIRTDIAQRLSLFLPIIAAITIFGEKISTLKYIGILIGFISIYLILSKDKQFNQGISNYSNWLFPISVFAGFGIIDILFKQLALYSAIPYTTSMLYVFIGAAIVSIIVNMFYMILKQKKINYNSLLFGIPLGIFNFLNIYFYLKAHQVFSENPTTVFAGMNFGVIILGSLVGYFIFKEKLRIKNIIGIILSLIAVSIILISQFYNL